MHGLELELELELVHELVFQRKTFIGCQLLEKYPENTQKIINEAFLYLVFVEIIFFPYNTFYC